MSPPKSKATATTVINSPIVAGIAVVASLGLVFEFRLRPAGVDQAHAAQQVATSTASLEVAVIDHSRAIERQSSTIETISDQVGEINRHVEGLESSLDNLRGYMQASLENLRFELREDIDEGDSQLRDEIIRMLESMMGPDLGHRP